MRGFRFSLSLMAFWAWVSVSSSSALAEPVRARRADLEALGWTVRIEAGYDHMNFPFDRQVEIIREAFDGHRW